MQRNASDAHVSSEISFIWHRGTIAPLTRIAIVLLFLRNKTGKCEALASQGKIISSHPVVYRGTRSLSYFTYRSRTVIHPRVCQLRKQMKYIEALLYLRRAEIFLIAEQVNRIENHRVNALSRKMHGAICCVVEDTCAPAANVSVCNIGIFPLALFQRFS